MTTFTPVTLGDLVHDGKLLWAYCLDCKHEADVDPAKVRLPSSFPVSRVGSRLKCSSCGSRNVVTKPELYPGRIAAQRAKFR